MDQERTTTKKQNMIAALRKTHGIITSACEIVDIARATYYNWLNDDPDFKREAEDIINEVKDFVEGKLFERINGVMTFKETPTGGQMVYQTLPDMGAIKFYLFYKARDRGYGVCEKNDKSLKKMEQDEQPTNITFTVVQRREDGYLDRLTEEYLPPEPKEKWVPKWEQGP